MRCLVTGGSGFFGHLLVEKLLARGEQVRNFDLNAADDEFEGVEFQRGDIRDADAVRRATDGVDVIYHNVAQQPLSKDPELMRSVNLDGTHNLLLAAQASGVTKIIYHVVDGNLRDPQDAADPSQHTTVALRSPMAERKSKPNSCAETTSAKASTSP